jgi:CHAT domain-containing protein
MRLPENPTALLWWGEADDLPNLRIEAQVFLEMFPHATICRTVDEVRRSMRGSYNVLHVASHAKLVHSNPMFSYIEFGGERILAAEVARSPLQVSLAVLSACETGSVSLSHRSEPDGLARAFLSRGAEAVVGSAWTLDDEAASRIVRPLYTALRQGKTLAEAMGTARSEARAWRSHPYFWSALVSFGGYRSS